MSHKQKCERDSVINGLMRNSSTNAMVAVSSPPEIHQARADQIPHALNVAHDP